MGLPLPLGWADLVWEKSGYSVGPPVEGLIHLFFGLMLRPPQAPISYDNMNI